MCFKSHLLTGHLNSIVVSHWQPGRRLHMDFFDTTNLSRICSNPKQPQWIWWNIREFYSFQIFPGWWWVNHNEVPDLQRFCWWDCTLPLQILPEDSSSWHSKPNLQDELLLRRRYARCAKWSEVLLAFYRFKMGITIMKRWDDQLLSGTFAFGV